MGTWAADNFANDEALDYAHELVDKMIRQVTKTIASKHGMEPDEPDSAVLMCNIDLMWLVGKHARLSMPEAETIREWKAKYLAVWDRVIDDLNPKPRYKTERRGVISKSVHQLIWLCKSREE